MGLGPIVSKLIQMGAKGTKLSSKGVKGVAKVVKKNPKKSAIAAAALARKAAKEMIEVHHIVAVVEIIGTAGREYSYYIPREMDGELEEGQMVRVPVEQGGPLKAIVLRINSSSRDVAPANKTIIEML